MVRKPQSWSLARHATDIPTFAESKNEAISTHQRLLFTPPPTSLATILVVQMQAIKIAEIAFPPDSTICSTIWKTTKKDYEISQTFIISAQEKPGPLKQFRIPHRYLFMSVGNKEEFYISPQ